MVNFKFSRVVLAFLSVASLSVTTSALAQVEFINSPYINLADLSTSKIQKQPVLTTGAYSGISDAVQPLAAWGVDKDINQIKYGWQPDYVSIGQIDRLKAVLLANNKKGDFANNYNWHKAACMTNLAAHVSKEANTKGVTEWLYKYAAVLEQASRTGEAANVVMPMLIGSQRRLKPELWDKISILNQYKNAPRCATPELACAPVSLLGLEYEATEGYENYKSHGALMLEAAENQLKTAQQKIADCDAEDVKKGAPIIAQAVQPLPPLSKPLVVQTKQVNLKADALFGFDGRALTDVKNDGVKRLDGVVNQLQTQFISIEGIEVKGFTDRIGRDAYNMQLSKLRADAVRDYIVKALVNNGLFAEQKITSMHFGATNPLATCKGDYIVKGKINNDLIACLSPNRRVEITAKGFVKAD